MIRKSNIPRETEQLHDFLIFPDGKKYEITWKVRVHHYYTCGPDHPEIECLETIPDSIAFIEVHQNGYKSRVLNLDQFHEVHPDKLIDMRSNSHGFTFTQGMYWLEGDYLNDILQDEYELISSGEAIGQGKYDVVCFQDTKSGKWVFSSKYENGLLIYKNKFGEMGTETDIENLMLKPENKNAVPYFFSRRQDSCSGVCHRAVVKESLAQ